MPAGSRRRPRSTLRTDSTITAALSLLDLPPFGYPAKAGLTPSVAEGRAEVEGTLRFPLQRPMPDGAVAVDVAAGLSDVASDDLIPGRSLAAAETDARGRQRASVGRAGRLRLGGGAGARRTWSRALGPGSAGSARRRGRRDAVARVRCSAFRIGLPDGSVAGQGTRAAARSTSRQSGPPAFSLASDLAGARLRIPQVGWSKAPGAAGRLEVAGRSGATPRVDRAALSSAPGLGAEGAVTARARTAGCERLRLDRVRVGDWLDGAGHADRPGRAGRPRSRVGGGRLDLRRADVRRGRRRRGRAARGARSTGCR